MPNSKQFSPQARHFAVVNTQVEGVKRVVHLLVVAQIVDQIAEQLKARASLSQCDSNLSLHTAFRAALIEDDQRHAGSGQGPFMRSRTRIPVRIGESWLGNLIRKLFGD